MSVGPSIGNAFVKNIYSAELVAEIVVARLIGPFRIWDLEGFGRNPIRILKHLHGLYASSYLYERVGPLFSASVNEPQ